MVSGLLKHAVLIQASLVCVAHVTHSCVGGLVSISCALVQSRSPPRLSACASQPLLVSAEDVRGNNTRGVSDATPLQNRL